MAALHGAGGVAAVCCGCLAVATASSIPPSDPAIQYEGRWETEALPTGGEIGTQAAIGLQFPAADWPCSSVRFGVSSAAGGNLTVRWYGLRTRLLMRAISGTVRVSVVLKGPAIYDGKSTLMEHPVYLARGNWTVLLRKLTQATPYSMGIGRILRPSVLYFAGLIVDRGMSVVSIPEFYRRIEFVGASDTAGYCVDGTPKTSGINDTLEGWEFSNCASAYPGLLGDTFSAAISVQALAGTGLTQNAYANHAWEEGKLTMVDLFNRTLQSRPGRWTGGASHRPDLIIISLGGNDFNHQNGHIPDNATFTAAYSSLLDRIFNGYPAGPTSLVIVSVCGMGSPGEVHFDPDNNRCRPCLHVEVAVKAYQCAQPLRSVEYIYVPCNGSVVTDQSDIGCNGHKNSRGQEEVARYLTPRIRQLMHWYS